MKSLNSLFQGVAEPGSSLYTPIGEIERATETQTQSVAGPSWLTPDTVIQTQVIDLSKTI